MRRLCTECSCSYSGRSVRGAFGVRDGSRTEAHPKGVERPPDPGGGAGSACASDRVRERTEVSRGRSSRGGKAAKGRTEWTRRSRERLALDDEPERGSRGGRRITQPALHVAPMEKVLAAENLRRAWRRVKANRGAPGMTGCASRTSRRSRASNGRRSASAWSMAATARNRCVGY